MDNISLDRRSFVTATGGALAAASLGALGVRGAKAAETADSFAGNIYTVAVVWKALSAEYAALYYQGFNIARTKVEAALANKGDKPLAVISDLDDTLISSAPYFQEQVARGENWFDDPLWDEMIASGECAATPGAVEFCQFCADNGVELFYVSSRNQEDDQELTDSYALAQLQKLGFPNADAEHLTMLLESSNKEEVQAGIAETHDVVVKLGDNLNGFNRSFYVNSPEERAELVEQQRASFGDEYVIFPNPTDGHWIRAIFGDSEPQDSPENRELWEKAASGQL